MHSFLELAIAAFDGVVKSSGNPLFGQLAGEGEIATYFGMAKLVLDPHYTPPPTSSSVLWDVGPRLEYFVAAAGQTGLAPSQDVSKTDGCRERKRRWEPRVAEFK